MSADRQRLKNAIRAIALTPEERRQLLGEGQNKGGKASSAGVGTSEAEESRLCCDGSTSDNANPGTDERDADAESQDGLDTNDPADLTSGDGTLSGVTDCETGEPICFDGAGFIPPDDWDDPNDPPADEDFVPGCRWFHTNVSGDYATPDAAYAAAAAANGWPEYCNRTASSDARCAGVNYFYEYAADGVNCVNGGGTAYSEAGETPEDEIPLEESWPSDGCVNLAIVGGKIVGSKYDPENSEGDYSAPRDEIQLCSGGEQIGLKPAANGGWKTINATTDSGYLWDSHGNKIAHIDGNEYSDPDV